MADTKISGMSAASALTGSEVLPVVQSASNVKATTQQVVDAAMTTGLSRRALGSINSNTTVDWSIGSYATATITGSLTFTFSNPAPAGKACVAYLELTNGGSAVITWPVSVTWAGATAPTLRASGVDLLRFYTHDGGSSWFGELASDEQSFDASAIVSGTIGAARLPAGTTSAAGALELATVAEAETGTDTARAVTPEGVASAIALPFTVKRWTRQSSALSAAASGETKMQMRDTARYPLPELLTDVGDPLLLFPSLADPLVSGWWVLNSTTTAFKGRYTLAGVAATTSASSLGDNIPALNYLTSASANAYAGAYVPTNGFRDGSATGNGYLIWGIFTTPDAGYGSGSTGAVINCGMDQAGGAVNGNRPSNRCALLQYNTNQSDTNWQLCVHNGTTLTTADTGCPFTAGGTWLWMIHSPRGSSSTYAYIKNLETGDSGSTTAASSSGSTSLYYMPAWVCTLSAVARNVRFVSAYLRAGGAN